MTSTHSESSSSWLVDWGNARSIAPLLMCLFFFFLFPCKEHLRWLQRPGRWSHQVKPTFTLFINVERLDKKPHLQLQFKPSNTLRKCVIVPEATGWRAFMGKVEKNKLKRACLMSGGVEAAHLLGPYSTQRLVKVPCLVDLWSFAWKMSCI